MGRRDEGLTWLAGAASARANDPRIHYNLGLLLQHLLYQVIQHKAVATSEGLDKVGGIFLPLHG